MAASIFRSQLFKNLNEKMKNGNFENVENHFKVKAVPTTTTSVTRLGDLLDFG